jgi:hypothetical protein
MRTSQRSGAVFPELLAGLVGIGLIATLITGAYAGARQRRQVDEASARLEEAQNLLARWRSGDAIAAPGWTCEIRQTAAGVEQLTIRGQGIRLSTLRPAGATP